jgi:3,4-dihydroxyphenylacetate 2,3-dioxygenase
VADTASRPPDIVRLAYVDLVVTDLERAREFWVDQVGFHLTVATDDALYLRGFDEFVHHSVRLSLGVRPSCERLGYRVRTPDDLDRAERWFAERGCAVRRVPAGTTLGFGEAVRVQDPFGFSMELVHEMEPVERLVQRYDLRRGSSVNRIDHMNVVTPDVQGAYEFYRDLGFGLSETIQDGDELYATWMFRKPSIHDAAFTRGTGPMLHHVGFHVAESHHILGLCDIMGSLDRADQLERGPGRHGVSNAFYLYLRDPDGHRVEMYTTDYFTGDPGHQPLRWDVRDPRRRDFWANPIVPGWFVGSAPFLDLDGNEVAAVEHGRTELTVGADGLGSSSGAS